MAWTAFDIIQLGNDVIIPLSLIPLVLNLKYYRQTKIWDYFLISIYFFIWSILQGLNTWYTGTVTPLYTVNPHAGLYPWFDFLWDWFLYHSTEIDSLPLFFVAIRAKYGGWKNTPLKHKILMAVGLLGVFIAYIDQEQASLIPHVIFTSTTVIARGYNRVYHHLMVIYSFGTAAYEKTSRANISRILWIISSFTWVIGWGFVIVLFFVIQVNFSVPTAIIFFSIVDFGYLLLFINHVFYPEAVLFTHHQINRALAMYKNLTVSENPLLNVGIPRIKEYIESLPEDLVADLRT